MTDAPERIWVAPWREGDWSEGDWDDNDGKTLNDKPCIQYVRADRIEALIAERDAAVGALRVIAGNNCITCSAEAFNVLFAMKHPAKIKEGKL